MDDEQAPPPPAGSSAESNPQVDLLAIEAELRPGILVVDDDRRNLFAMAELLRDERHHVVLAASGEEALTHLLREEFAVILLDVHMPGLDGYQTATLIRGRAQTRSIPIIFLTAHYKEDAHAFEGYGVGAVDYLLKPVNSVILKAKIAVFCDLYRKAAAARRYAEAARKLYDERLRTERALDRRDEEQSLILSFLPIALYKMPVASGATAPRFVRGSVEDLTGFPPHRFLNDGAFWWDRIHPADRDRVLGAFAQIAETGAVTVEYRWECADGSYRHLLDQAVRMTDGPDGRGEIFGLWLDITSRKRLEDKLRQAQRLEALGLLAGGIVHDFNNLLMAIIGNLDRLESMAAAHDGVSAAAGAARRAASHGEDLVRQLLAFSQRQRLRPDTVDLAGQLKGALDLIKGVIGAGIAVEADMAPDLWPVRIDAGQVELALLNLAANARDAMPTSGVLRLTAKNVTLTGAEGHGLAGDFVALAVSDTGTGIAPEILERIVEPFFTTKPEGKGSGLGLSQVYGFAKQSGGTVDIVSTMGKGTQVTMYLPRSSPESD